MLATGTSLKALALALQYHEVPEEQHKHPSPVCTVCTQCTKCTHSHVTVCKVYTVCEVYTDGANSLQNESHVFKMYKIENKYCILYTISQNMAEPF